MGKIINKFENLLVINKPEDLFIKIDDDKDFTILPKVGDCIYKCSILAHAKGNIKSYIYSPISGKINDIVNKNIDNKLNKYINIKNDYREMNEELKGINKNICNFTKEEFLEKLSLSGINDNNYSIYLKYENNIKTLIIDNLNSIQNTSNYIIMNYLDDILETIDAIIEINKIDNCFIIINKKDKQIKNMLEQKIGTYLKIKLLCLPIRKNDKKIKIIAKKLKVKELNYINENIENIYAIHNILKYNIPYIEKFIILNINKKAYPIKLKIGTEINYIFKILKININNFIIGNNLESKKTADQNIIIDNNIEYIKL